MLRETNALKTARFKWLAVQNPLFSFNSFRPWESDSVKPAFLRISSMSFDLRFGQIVSEAVGAVGLLG